MLLEPDIIVKNRKYPPSLQKGMDEGPHGGFPARILSSS
jgi:hypothetical protein